MADEHRDLTVGDLHALANWKPADASARAALTVASTDVGKLAWQLDDDTFWVLKDDAPLTWVQVGGGTGGGGASVGAWSSRPAAGSGNDGQTRQRTAARSSGASG